VAAERAGEGAKEWRARNCRSGSQAGHVRWAGKGEWSGEKGLLREWTGSTGRERTGEGL
jgi:hypothetical protein